ncbi:uncharacterized protein LOC130956775 [Arachis stenosperma]|uniref:uncharacterized protein LOC130956775 n=1 Tax=Arachis stenosperma TaxID=217475 RepID=UPI0025ABF9DC|nr:uncharacterized protein LOC130956775 [Arachis stenosperma]
MARNFDDMFNEALYSKKRRGDNTLIDNWINECLFDNSKEEDINKSSIPTPHRWINTDREAGHDRIFQDYFADEPVRRGLSPLQKCTAAIWMLAYAIAVDAIDDYVCIGESTTIECLKKFVEGVISVFKDKYLQKPNLNLCMVPAQNGGGSWLSWHVG